MQKVQKRQAQTICDELKLRLQCKMIRADEIDDWIKLHMDSPKRDAIALLDFKELLEK